MAKAWVEKRKRGDQERWTVRWYTLQGRERLKTCSSKSAADSLASKLNYHFDLGVDWDPVQAPVQPALPIDLWTVSDTWLEIRKADLASLTLRRYAEAADRLMEFIEAEHLKDYIAYPDGKRRPPATLLSKALMEDFKVWLTKPKNGRHKRARGPTTVGNLLNAIFLMWEWAEESERWKDIPRARRVDLPRRPRPDPVAPTWEELDAMLRELHGVLRWNHKRAPKGVDPAWAMKLAVMVRYLGTRRTETLSLEWSSADLAGAVLRIPAGITKGTYGGRELPLHPDLVARMERWGTREGKIIKAPERELPPQRGHVDRLFRRAWKRAKVPFDRWDGQPLHAARYTIETEWAAANVHQGVIDAYLGHAGASTGERHYRATRRLWPRLVEAVGQIPLLDPRIAVLD